MTRYLIVLMLFVPQFLIAQNVVLNEIMAANQMTIYDEDGDTPDWIELYNSGSESVNLNGYGLSDDSLQTQKWQFGDTVIEPGQHLLVFASDKDRSVEATYWETVITEGDNWKYNIGSASIPLNWNDPSFDDSVWDEGPSGFGYSDGDDNTDLQAQSPFSSLFIRKTFVIDDLNAVIEGVLHVDYDDGFVAYINGVEIARAELGQPGNAPAWNALASGHEATMYTGGAPERFGIKDIQNMLVEGENTIAIQVHNATATSTDMSLIPFLSFNLSSEPANPHGSPDILGLSSSASTFHTNFKISASGEQILLSNADGAIIDLIDMPASEPDISFARKNDGSLPWFFQLPTPGEQNTGVEFAGTADAISVSLPGGFYNDAVTVELSTGNSQIFYTLDGSDPDSTASEYSGPITITQTSVLKAIGLKKYHLPSPVIYQTYFINEPTDLPVISLSSDPYNIFDVNYGIYPNYTEDWERPAHVEFFDDNKDLGFSENCGIEIFGSQSATWDQKSMSIKFKAQYGVSGIEYPLFPDFPVTTFKAFVLRNSGNDWQYTHIRDAVMETLVKDLDIDYLEYRPAASFINGEYWGIYNIREKINEHYIANRHGVDPDNIDLLENNMNVIQGDEVSYQQLIDYVSTNDMTTDAAYTYLDSVIDLDECILYFAAQAYYDNMDWPGTNIKFWRERSASGKWRWILFGLDFGFGLYAHGPSEDHIEFMFSPVETRYSNPPWATLLQRKLVENPTIRNRFINQIADLLNTNFTSERVVNVINTLGNHIANELPRHRARWGLGGETLAKMTTFAQERPGYLRTHVRSYFRCGNNGTITLNSTPGGKVKLNTLYFESSELPWSGTYFQSNEVHLKAIPAPGYKFDGWSGNISSADASVTLNVGTATEVAASFSIDNSVAKDIVINEINYHSDENFYTGDWVEFYNRSDHVVNLSDWTFSDSDPAHRYSFPYGTSLAPQQYLVLAENDSAFSARYPDISNHVGRWDFGLSGTGESIQLHDEEGQLIDSLSYDDEAPWPTAAAGLGATLELIDPAIDNSLPENWLASSGHGSPGRINSVVNAVENRPDESIPQTSMLYQNYPNPFNPTTKIGYRISETCQVKLSIFNTAGQLIENIVNEQKSPGEYSASWSGKNLSSGIYIYKLSVGAHVSTRKMLMIK